LSNPEPIVVKRLPFPLDEGNDWSVSPASDGFAITGFMNWVPIRVAFLDPNTLDVKSEVRDHTDNPIVGMNYDGFATTTGNPGPPYGTFVSYDMHFFSRTDGREVGVFRNVGVHAAVDHGFLLQHAQAGASVDAADKQSGVFYFDMRSLDLTGPIAPSLESLNLGGRNSGFDPGAADVSVYGESILLHDASFAQFLTIFDMAARKVVFSLSDARQLGSLGIAAANFGGDYLYLNNHSDNPVTDYRTSKSVSSGWKIMPVTRLAGGWVLLIAGGPAQAGNEDCAVASYRVACHHAFTTDDYLGRDKNGDYAGPWY